MSASKQKRLRQLERQEHPELAEKKTEGMSTKKKVIITVVVLVIAALLAAGIFAAVYFTSGSAARSAAAVKVGDHELTAAEYSYFYSSSYQNYVSQYGDYLSYLGLDTSLPLSEQTCTYADESDPDMTWEEYFQQYAESSIKQVFGLCDEAEKNGFELSEEDKANIETTLDAVKANASSNNMSLDDYFKALLGGGVNEDVFRKMLTKETLAYTYAQKVQLDYEFTDAELNETYDANKDTFDVVTYRTFLFDYTSYLPDDVDATSASTEQTDAAKAKAKELAEEFHSKLEPDLSNFNALCAEYAPDDGSRLVFENNDKFSLYENEYLDGISESAQQVWLRDSARVKNDSAVVDTTNGNYYVTAFISRGKPMDNTVNVRHILIAPTTEVDSETGMTDEQIAEVRQSAEQRLNEWKSGAATEDSFAELANLYSSDTSSNTVGGLYEKVYKGEMPSEFNAWCFDSSRKTGDTGIAMSDSGAHVLYFIGEDDPYWRVQAEDRLISDTFTQFLTTVTSGLTVEHLDGFKWVAEW